VAIVVFGGGNTAGSHTGSSGLLTCWQGAVGLPPLPTEGTSSTAKRPIGEIRVGGQGVRRKNSFADRHISGSELTSAKQLVFCIGEGRQGFFVRLTANFHRGFCTEESLGGGWTNSGMGKPGGTAGKNNRMWGITTPGSDKPDGSRVSLPGGWSGYLGVGESNRLTTEGRPPARKRFADNAGYVASHGAEGPIRR